MEGLTVAVERADEEMLEHVGSLASFDDDRTPLALTFEHWDTRVSDVENATSSDGRTALNSLVLAMHDVLVRYKRVVADAIATEKRLERVWEEAVARAASCRAKAAPLVGPTATIERSSWLHEALGHERFAAGVRQRGLLQAAGIDDLRERHGSLLQAVARARSRWVTDGG